MGPFFPFQHALLVHPSLVRKLGQRPSVAQSLVTHRSPLAAPDRCRRCFSSPLTPLVSQPMAPECRTTSPSPLTSRSIRSGVVVRASARQWLASPLFSSYKNKPHAPPSPPLIQAQSHNTSPKESMSTVVFSFSSEFAPLSSIAGVEAS